MLNSPQRNVLHQSRRLAEHCSHKMQKTQDTNFERHVSSFWNFLSKFRFYDPKLVYSTLLAGWGANVLQERAGH
jgi:hypothetical protein